jgi:hypothetical protein
MIPNPDLSVRNRTNFAALPQSSHHLRNLDSGLGEEHSECGSKITRTVPRAGPSHLETVKTANTNAARRVRTSFAAFSRK